jgi:hypothetical protein
MSIGQQVGEVDFRCRPGDHLSKMNATGWDQRRLRAVAHGLISGENLWSERHEGSRANAGR